MTSDDMFSQTYVAAQVGDVFSQIYAMVLQQLAGVWDGPAFWDGHAIHLTLDPAAALCGADIPEVELAAPEQPPLCLSCVRRLASLEAAYHVEDLAAACGIDHTTTRA